MHAILVIFKKDVRRLWWQIAVMLALSAAVGYLDARRTAVTPGIVESLLNILLPLVWACLIAQSVHEEAMVGDREFWMTRPYRWPRLLAAKVLFALVFVHAPSLATDAAILAARGFNPLASLPQLLGKQLLLAGGLTLPAMALAAVVSNVTQFVIGVPVLFAALALATYQSRFGFDSIRNHIAIGVLGVAAGAIVLLQYRRRRTILARILAVSTVLVVGLGLVMTSLQRTFGLAAGIHPVAHTQVNLTLERPGRRLAHAPYPRRVIAELPFTVSGWPKSDRSVAMAFSMAIEGANGVRYESGSGRWDFDMGMGMSTMTVGLSRADYDRIKDSKVTISGTAGFVLYELGQAVRLPVGVTRDVPGVGHCSSTYDEGRYDTATVNVFCDSPSRNLGLAPIEIDEKWKGRAWPVQRLYGTNNSPSPLIAWLSPLQRRVLTFQIGGTPGEVLADAPIVIVPQRSAGFVTVCFRASDIDLREYTWEAPGR